MEIYVVVCENCRRWSHTVIFTVESLHNRQNRRQLIKKGQQKTVTSKTIGCSHFSVSIMVWAGICANGRRHWSSSKEMTKSMPPAISKESSGDVLDPNGCALQQDWVPAHSANKSAKNCFQAFNAGSQSGEPSWKKKSRLGIYIDASNSLDVYSTMHRIDPML